MLTTRESLLILFLILASGVFIYFWISRSSVSLEKMPVRVGQDVLEVELARSFLARQKGLSGRTGLKDNEGMLFIFPKPGHYGFWMKEMNFPIDIVWIKEGKILDWEENVKPEPQKGTWGLTVYYPPEPVEMVLEVAAQTVKKRGWDKGARLDLPAEVLQ